MRKPFLYLGILIILMLILAALTSGTTRVQTPHKEGSSAEDVEKVTPENIEPRFPVPEGFEGPTGPPRIKGPSGPPPSY